MILEGKEVLFQLMGVIFGVGPIEFESKQLGLACVFMGFMFTLVIDE